MRLGDKFRYTGSALERRGGVRSRYGSPSATISGPVHNVVRGGTMSGIVDVGAIVGGVVGGVMGVVGGVMGGVVMGVVIFLVGVVMGVRDRTDDTKSCSRERTRRCRGSQTKSHLATIGSRASAAGDTVAGPSLRRRPMNTRGRDL
jgi:hypothetical protein